MFSREIMKPNAKVEKAFKLLSSTEFGVKASDLELSEFKDVIQPMRMRDQIPTLNRQGYMKINLDEYSAAFIEETSKVDMSIDIGCAFGFVVERAIRRGKKIVAFDLSYEHLILTAKGSPIDYLDNIYLKQGRLPEEYNFPKDSFGAILASRVIHFLRGYEVSEALEKIHSSLIKGGRFFCTAVTPYHSAIKDGAIEMYQQAIKAGVLWPGEIENQWAINPKDMEYVEPFLHTFDKAQIEELLPRYGFEIEKISLFDYPNEDSSGGKGHIGFIARTI